MPTYEYRCNSCGNDFEAFQRFDDAPLTECPKCGAPVHKVFSSVGIVFKGSGFYSTDNHKSSKPAAPAKETGGDAKKSPKKDSAPAEKAKPAPAPSTD